MKTMRNLFGKYQHIQRDLTNMNLATYSASCGFFFFVSLIPLVMVLCALLPYTPVTKEVLLGVLRSLAPKMVDQFITEIVTDIYHSTKGVLTISVIMAIWSAGKGMLSLIRGFNAIYDIPETRKYIALRLFASFYTVMMLIVVVWMLMILMFGDSLLLAMEQHFPGGFARLSGLLHLRFLISLVFFTLMLMLLYTFVPSKKLRLKDQFVGAAFTSVVWTLASWGFSLYIDVLHGFRTYGNMTKVIVVLLYLYAMFYIVFVGAYINKQKGMQPKVCKETKKHTTE